MTDTTNDPIAAAAAQLDAAPSSTEPSLLERALDKVHAVEEEIQHLIHPDASIPAETPATQGEDVTPGAEQGNAGTPAAENTAETNSATPEAPSAEVPNAAASPAAEQPASDTSSSVTPALQESATPAASASAAIRDHLQTIRSHLSLMGFEQGTVAVIHESMAEIEKLL